MNIYLYELKSLRKSTVIWICALIGMAALYLSIYPSMASDAEDFKELLGSYPASFQAMLGINLDIITSILGFYSMIFSFVVLCGAIQAMNLGVSILSKESRERTADFLLVKPVSRTTIVTAKIAAGFTMIVITNIVFCIGSTVLANLVKTEDFDLKIYFMINLTLFFIQIIFMALGLVVSVFFKKIKNILPISLGTVFGLYLIGALIAADKNDSAARILSPFKYFDISDIINTKQYETNYLILSAAIVLVSIIVTYVVFRKKDIHAVS